MKTNVIARVVILSLAVLFLLLVSANFALAHYGASWDYPGHKRNLNIKIPGSEPWKGWAQEAIKNWNDADPPTGWSFTETDADPDVTIETADIPKDDQAGGGRMKANPTGDPGEATVTITMDTDVTDELMFGAGSDSGRLGYPSGGTNGWSKSEPQALDPVLVLKHELGHALRLKHGDGQNTGNLEEPISRGNHDNPVDRKPSANDIAEATEGAQSTGPTVAPKDIGPDGGSHNYSRTNINIESGTLDSTATFWIMYLNPLLTPDPSAIESPGFHDDRGIIYAVDLSTDYSNAFTKPVEITMQYTNEEINGGYSLGEQHTNLLPSLNESSLKIYGYNQGTGYWEEIPSTLDKQGKTLTFYAHHFSLYGIGGEAQLPPTGGNIFALVALGILSLFAGLILLTRNSPLASYRRPVPRSL